VGFGHSPGNDLKGEKGELKGNRMQQGHTTPRTEKKLQGKENCAKGKEISTLGPRRPLEAFAGGKKGDVTKERLENKHTLSWEREGLKKLRDRALPGKERGTTLGRHNGAQPGPCRAKLCSGRKKSADGGRKREG